MATIVGLPSDLPSYHPPLYDAIHMYRKVSRSDSMVVSETSSLSYSTRDSFATLGSDSSLSRSDSVDSSKSLDSIDSAPPPYTPALMKAGSVRLKSEFDTPFTRTSYRQWRSVKMEVNNTQLKLSYSSMGGMVTHNHVYSLQFAEVGLASDYTKKLHTIRLRVESKQLLVSFQSCEEMQSWLVALLMAISLALPLELRQLPEEVKRTRNRHRDRERRRQRHIARQQAERTHHQQRQIDQQQQRNFQPRHVKSITRVQQPAVDVVPAQAREDTTAVKWDPRHRQSRFNEKDFPHLTLNSPWEGKCVLYRGEWAMVRGHQVIFVATDEVAVSARSRR